MAEVRRAEEKDRRAFLELWKVCFGDSDAFCDWFFTHRFLPSYSVVLETEGEIASCMQAFPYALWIRGREIPAAMLCGVSTHPNHRKKGYMGQIFRYEMQLLREKGCMVAPHTPAVLPSYFAFGHLPVADAGYLTCRAVPSMKESRKLVSVEGETLESLYPFYQRIVAGYSGIVARTKEDFLRKAADYAADGGKCAAYIEKKEIKGYAFYYRTEQEMTCVEVLAEDGHYHSLLEGLFAWAKGLAFSAKLPPERYLSFPFAKLERKQKGVMGFCNVAALLKALELQIPYSLQVVDTVLPENNGVFDFRGNLVKDTPVFTISAGHLLQALVGYASLEELREELQIFDEERFQEIHALLPKQDCYIIDEY